MPNPPVAELIQSLKEQIDQLAEEQSHAMRSAVYIRMNRKERKEYDERLDKIAELVRQLKALEEPAS